MCSATAEVGRIVAFGAVDTRRLEASIQVRRIGITFAPLRLVLAMLCELGPRPNHEVLNGPGDEAPSAHLPAHLRSSEGRVYLSSARVG